MAASVFPGSLTRYDDRLRIIDSISVMGGIVDMQFTDKGGIACNIGNINPNNAKLGNIAGMYYDDGGKMHLDAVPFCGTLHGQSK